MFGGYMKSVGAFLGIFIVAFMLISCDGKKEPEPQQQPEVAQHSHTETGWGYEDENNPLPPSDIPSPIIAVDGKDIQLGRVYFGDIRVLWVKLKNTGDKPVKLQSIDASCSCTNVDGIPGGRIFAPGEEWKMAVRLDSARLPLGKFTREVILNANGYAPYRIYFSGENRELCKILPFGSKIRIAGSNDPSASWKEVVQIDGADSEWQGKVVLVPRERKESDYLQANATRLPDGKWQVEISPRRPLPWTDSFSEEVRLQVLEPADAPDIRLKISGRSGTSVNFSPRSFEIPAEAAPEGDFTFTAEIGYDPYEDNGEMNEFKQMEMRRYAEKVDWRAVHKSFKLPVPEGMSVTMQPLRFGVRVTIRGKNSMIPEGKGVTLTAEAQGSPMAKLVLRRKK